MCVCLCCVCVCNVCVRVCVPVTGLVSLILPSVAGAPRSSFSRAMTRFEIVMKLLIYRSLSRLCDSPQTDEGVGGEIGGRPAHVRPGAKHDVSFVVGGLNMVVGPSPTPPTPAPSCPSTYEQH